MRSALLAALALALATNSTLAQDSTSSRGGVPWLTPLLDRFELLPEYHLTGDLYFIGCYKNTDDWRRYFVENNAELEFVLASYHRRWYSTWGLYVRTTMGRQDGAIMFDPRELRYVIDPAVELRLDLADLRAGLDHTCHHEIDSWDGTTEYWNKGYLDVRAKNARAIEYRRKLVNEGRWDFASRFSWEVRGGHYFRRAFGLLDPVIVGGGHDYDWEITATNRWALFKRLDWVVDTRTVANLNLSRARKVRQTYQIGFEGHLRRGDAGLMLFVYYYLLDQLLVRPKDRLLEIGVRFYN